MADNIFVAEVDAIILQTQKRIDALIRQSVNDVIDDAQIPVAKGGRMRVDTGFLRASGQLSLTGMPQGPVRGDPKGSYDFDAAKVEVQLAGVTAGQTIFWGWTAGYAAYREAKDGFLAGAVQKWQTIVAKNAAIIISRIVP